jgi:hypothetical protein
VRRLNSEFAHLKTENEQLKKRLEMPKDEAKA